MRKLILPIGLLSAAVLAFTPAYAQLRGHGGPVRALAVSPTARRDFRQL
jgi:hypothetical protein